MSSAAGSNEQHRTPAELIAAMENANRNIEGKSWFELKVENNARNAAAWNAMTPSQRNAHAAWEKKMSWPNGVGPVKSSGRNNRRTGRGNRGNRGNGRNTRRNGRGNNNSRRGAAAAAAAAPSGAASWRSSGPAAAAAAAPSSWGPPAASSWKSSGGPGAWKPRPGKFMRECRDNRVGCKRHQTTGDCKFIHSDEPEFEHLRSDQRL